MKKFSCQRYPQLFYNILVDLSKNLLADKKCPRMSIDLHLVKRLDIYGANLKQRLRKNYRMVKRFGVGFRGGDSRLVPPLAAATAAAAAAAAAADWWWSRYDA